MSTSEPRGPSAKQQKSADVTTVLRTSDLLKTLRAYRRGDFSARMEAGYTGVAGEIAERDQRDMQRALRTR